MTRSTARRDRWDAHARVPLIILGIGFVVAYPLQILWQDMPRALHWTTVVVTIVSWLAFIVDYLVRLALTPKGGHLAYIVSTPIDFLSMFLPIFRALRVVDLVRNAGYFRMRNGNAQRAAVLVYAASYSILYVFFVALATLQVERHAKGAHITNFPDAVWWAFETISTVGYGDMYPVTGLGRFYAILLMIGGIVIVGVVSGTIVSYIGDKIRMPVAAPHHSGHSHDAHQHEAHAGSTETRPTAES